MKIRFIKNYRKRKSGFQNACFPYYLFDFTLIFVNSKLDSKTSKFEDLIRERPIMTNDAKEQSCWREFIAGEEFAFRRLYDLYTDRLFAFGNNYCKQRETVKDAIHDLFIDLYRYREKLDPNVNLQAYIYTSFRRKLALSLKKAGRQESLATDHKELIFMFHEGGDENMEASIIRDEQEREISRLLSRQIQMLPSRQQEALYLRFTLEASYEEAAGIMAVSVATARTLVYRAVRQLRANMEEMRVSLAP